MKTTVHFFVYCVLGAMAFACSQGSDILSIDDDFQGDNEHIKSVSSNGVIVHKYYYDSEGKIVEENCLSYFQKYLYDATGRLVKVESAFDESMYFSSIMERRTEFMTSKNSAVKNYTLYEYDQSGRLSKCVFYFNSFNTEGKFELRSSRTFVYEGSNIVRVNLHDDTGRISQYNVYAYDRNGNVTNNKYYSNLFGATNKLVSETSCKYDNYKNPYRIFRMQGNPGLFSNANNIIEINLIRHEEVQGLEKYSTSKTSYEYNKAGYPVKEITENGVWEYNY